MVAVMQSIDRRTVSHMGAETLLVHMRLEAWGRWARDGLQAWAARNVIGRLMDEGAGAGHVGAAPVGEIPEAVAQTDRAVAHLGELDRRVIRAFYTEWAPIEIMARRLRLPPRRFKAVLNRARWRISGYLAAHAEL